MVVTLASQSDLVWGWYWCVEMSSCLCAWVAWVKVVKYDILLPPQQLVVPHGTGKLRQRTTWRLTASL